MQLGIIGLPLVGKTTIFELLTEAQHKGLNAAKANTAIARIPDSRIDYLAGIFKPRKTTFAQMEVIDIPGLVPGAEKAASMFLDTVRKADALLHVVRVFTDDSVPMLNNDPNPIKNIETINYELILADLDLIEKRIERINKSKKKQQMEKELLLLQRLNQAIENELPLSSVSLDNEEVQIMSTYQFLTTKPLLICLNIGENDLSVLSYAKRDDIINYLQQSKLPFVEISASIELEISQLNGEDKLMFMEEANIKESGIVRISRTIYESLGLISFFTVGDDEVKAWTIEKNTIARKAAGKIHSDIERGFIRAEVVEYAKFKEYGTMQALKEKGLLRLEGKEYVVNDGDIVHFRFNV